MPKILAIDDINDNLISLKAIINDAFPGTVVMTSLNGQKGIELAIANNPDVILLDIIMPEMDGFEVCRFLKLDERVRDIPVVFLTALKGDKESRIKALEVGAEGFLSKPIDETELTAQIRAMIKIKAANEQKRDEKERLEKMVEERTKELVHSQAQLRGIFENLQDAYFQTDLSGRLTIVSPSSVKMYGYQSPDELIGQSAGNLYFDINERTVLLSLLGSAGRIRDYVCQGRKKDGSAFWVSMNVQLLKSSDGQVLGTEGVVRDISERKKAGDVLKESEERFRHISSSISDISYSCINDSKGNSEINWLYGATEKITGYSIDELFAMKCWGKLVTNEDFPIFKSHTLGVLPGKSETCQLRLKRKDGNVVWIQATAECVRGPEGADFNILYGGIVDITERKQAEELLRESEEKYRIMVELMPDAVIIHEGGEFVFANATALKTVGANSFEQLIERPLMDYVHPDFRNISLSRIKEIYSTGQPSAFSEEKFITLNNEIIDVEVIGIPILYRSKPAIQTIIRDITKRKKAEAALKESEERFKLIFEASNVAESITLPTGEINVNQAFCDMFGYTKEELKGKKWQEVTFPEEVEIDQKLIDSILRGERNATRRIKRYLHKSGKTIIGDVSYALIRDDNKKPLHFITTIIDITDQKRAEDELHENVARLELAMEVANMSWWEMDMTTGQVIFEKRKAEMLGYSPEKFKHYTDFVALVHPDDLERTMDAMRSHLNGSLDKYEVEYRIKTISGEYKWFYDVGSVTKKDSEGSPLIVSGLVLNISERKEAEELLNASNEFSESLLKTIPFGMDIVDEHGNILFQSENMENVFSKKAIGCKCWNLYRDDKIQCIECPLIKGIQIGKTETYESAGVLGGRIFEISHTGMMFKGKKAMLEIFQDITERKQAEEEMRTAKKLLEQTFDQSPVPMVLVSMPDMMIRIVNPACLSFLGITDEPSLINTPLMGIDPTWQDLDIQNRPSKLEDLPLARSLMGGKTEGEERCIIRKDGTIRYELVNSFPIFNDQNEIIAGTLIMTDITERKQVLEELQNSHNMLEKLAAQVPGVVYKYRLYPDGRSAFPFSSVGMYDIYEVTPEEVREDASPVFTRLHPDDYDYIVETITESARNQTFYHSEFRVILPKQGLRWRMSDAKPELLEDGSTLWHGIITDITERKQGEEALRESVQLFKGLFNASPDAIVLIDPHHPTNLWPIVDCNEVSCRMNGYTREEMIGQSIDLLNVSAGKPEERKTYYNELKKEGILHIETVHRHKDGHIFPIETSSSIVTIGGHEMVLGIDRDITERKRAEAELSEINQRFSELVASTDGIIWEADVETFTFSFVSKNAERILGYDIEDWLQPRFWANHILEDDRSETVQFCVDQTNMCNNHDFEYRFIAKDGRIVWLADYVKVIVENGKPQWLHGLMVDVTERKRAEMALKDSEDRYRQFISQVSEGVYRFECDQPMDINLSVEDQVDFIYDHMFIAECNDAFLKMYGIKDRKDMIGKGHLDFHGSRYNPVNRGSLVTFVKNGYRIENTMTEEINYQGQVFYISNNSLGIIENNRLVRMWGTQIDITEKIRADKVQQVLYTISNATLSAIDLAELIEIISKELGKLLDSTNFFIAFYNENTNMLSTIYEKDEKDVIQTWSAEKSMTGYVIRNQESLLIHEPEVKQLIESGAIENFGTPAKVWLGVPLKLNKKVIGAIVVQSYDNPEAFTEKDKLMLEFISHQISISVERKKVEQELNTALIKAKESDRLKSAFLANMSHEIRTPLNSIIGFSDLLFDPEFDEEQKRSFAENISLSGNGLLAIINDIMDLSKIETGQVQVNKSRFIINQLIRDIQREYSFKAFQKGIELRIDPFNPVEEIFIKSDENKLRQVLINFVSNALKFTENGFIEIGIRDKGDNVYVQVKDTGIGIPEEYHDKVFERFRQVESAESRKYGGNGLGLAISKSLIEILGGKIGIKSTKGSGSTFYFTIPK